jgi:hypothetical protein
MSYEGYEQVLCKNGHASVFDAWDMTRPRDDDWKCPAVTLKQGVPTTCGAPMAWSNDVNVTNGSWDEDGTRIDGYVEVDAEAEAETCKCDKCGNEHVVDPPRFKIPKDKGRRHKDRGVEQSGSSPVS